MKALISNRSYRLIGMIILMMIGLFNSVEVYSQSLAEILETIGTQIQSAVDEYNGVSNNNRNPDVADVKRERFMNGYTETITYKDGHQFITNYLPCPNCNRTKICQFCNGNGYWSTPYYGQTSPCMGCGQSGRCNSCNENGYAISTSFMRLPNGQILSGQSGDFLGGGSSNYGTSNSSNGKTGKCSYCNGTGVDPTHCDGGAASWAAYYNSKGTKCPHCGQYDGHMHSRCPSCNVPKH